ncbi:restriction endonuclease subunit S [Gaetbulibacter sp. NE]|uniref:restriction endonuclease subunit S n=1 Tax=Gaetbulibacter sp. NE TaxID=2982307 RepID=UPI0021CF9DEB|nr:restriction endonuclease subunit S [Gaetbulibacter sp. NE]
MLGDYIQPVNNRNKSIITEDLRGLSMSKEFRKSTSNIVGVDLSKYKLVYKNQFACDFMSVIRVHKLPVVLHSEEEPVIVSPAYTVFEVTDENVLLPEYLMMWFRRPEFDRYADFRCDSAIRGGFKWDELCEVTLPIPSIEQQQQIVDEYNTVTNRIQLNEQINQNLEATAQALYKHWFVDFEFPIDLCQSELVEDPNCHLEHVTSSTSPRAQSRGEKREVSLETLNKIDFTKGYKSSGGKMVYNEELDKEIPVGWSAETVKGFSLDMKSGATPNRSKIDYWNSNDYSWIKTGELKNSVIINSEESISSLGLKNSSTKLLPINSVLIAMYGQGNTKGQVGYLKIEATTNQACCAMICEDESHSTFLYYHLRVNRDEIVKDAIGGAQPNLSKELIEKISIIKPTKDILLKTPFTEILNSRWKTSLESQKLKDLQSLLLAKMTQGVTKTVGV